MVVPHPDDAEFLCGGSMARWASEGKEIILVVVTNGAAGSNDPAVRRHELIRTREEEQRRSAKILGISEVVFLGYDDGYVEDSHELRRDLIKQIRARKPDVVVGLDPSLYYFADRYINHPDHRRVGEATLAAVSPGSTTVPTYREDLFDKGFGPHQVKVCLLGFSEHSDFYVDVSDFIDQKIAALKEHVSQFPEQDGFGDRVKEMAAMVAGRFNLEYKYAEAFKAFYLDRSFGRPADEGAGDAPPPE